MTVVINGTSGITDVNGTAAAPAITGTDTDTGMYFGTNTVSFATNGTAVGTFDASGNLNVGTTGINSNFRLNLTSPSGNGGIVFVPATDGSAVPVIRMLNAAVSTNVAEIGTASGTAMYFSTNATERARIDSSGNLLVGTTTLGNAGWSFYGSSTLGASISKTNGTTTFTHIEIKNGNGTVGSIQSSGSTTSYNTSSDYRLKENIAPMTGALAKVAALKPVTYTWKIDGSAGEGFIAHELQAVVPDAVSGEKDATRMEQYEISPAVPATYDEEGNELTPAVEAVMGEREVPVYQGIDTSFLVATLTAAIQELKAEFDAYKAAHP